MGYITTYRLEAYETHIIDCNQWGKLVGSITDPSFDKDHLIKIYNKDGVEYKWFRYENEMIRLSQYFPNLTFVISGEGEDREDNWSESWQNGKRLTYWFSEIGDKFLRWAKIKAPDAYQAFINELTETYSSYPHNGHNFRIGLPSRPSPIVPSIPSKPIGPIIGIPRIPQIP
jgi:hypothetical protein